jgi:hypothetical protein
MNNKTMSPGIHAARLLKGMASAPFVQSLPSLPNNLMFQQGMSGGNVIMPSLMQREGNPRTNFSNQAADASSQFGRMSENDDR